VAPFFPLAPLPRQTGEGLVYTDGKMLPPLKNRERQKGWEKVG